MDAGRGKQPSTQQCYGQWYASATSGVSEQARPPHQKKGAFNPGAHLTFHDIVVDSAQSHKRVKVRIKASKTDQFQEGSDVYLGRTGMLLCPVAAVLAYMVTRKDGPGPTVPF